MIVSLKPAYCRPIDHSHSNVKCWQLNDWLPINPPCYTCLFCAHTKTYYYKYMIATVSYDIFYYFSEWRVSDF